MRAASKTCANTTADVVIILLIRTKGLVGFRTRSWKEVVLAAHHRVYC
uniref:Secreted protein n=1 Tax=Phakopsora pachyrhizi TaxID=170000 RepID=A0A0S1MJW7_PHAPC